MVEHRGINRLPALRREILLFGPLALSFDQEAFKHLRKTIIDSKENYWALDALNSLPYYYTTIRAAIPGINGVNGAQLQDLKSALNNEKQLLTGFPLSNTLLIPLIVILHLTQYWRYLEQASMELESNIDLFVASHHNKETVGFCTGLLSAMAVSAAKNQREFCKYAAVAVRLGLLVGMVVDAQDGSSAHGPSKSISASWKSSERREEAQRILNEFPQAYISVYYDEDRATITAPASKIPDLHQRLRAAGIVTADVGLNGSFHTERYRGQLESIIQFCDSHPDFQLSDASKAIIPTRSNATGDFIREGALHQHALQSILVNPPQWYQTFTAVRDACAQEEGTVIVSFGSERCVPPSLLRGLSQKVVTVADLDIFKKDQYTYSENDIAVVGMSCKVAGADNLEEFWDLLCMGKSQHREVPKERFGFETVFREVDPNRKWFGNFIDGHDQFDHKFFKKSPRESATMDPQQRHLLQITYQAVEQSGYFHSANPDRHIGCYIGVCACDYENNIACHAPNAFSATGNLQGFIAGKVSHFFGWTGPGLTIDTACSSSAVAVHQACKAIITGECTAALAGGTHVMTNPLWFQNLAGASFLSTTGQCKPFDIKADGYCRGEGIATVFLKKLSAALNDGDQILGVITATAVQQNQNCTPIFVPNVPSLSDLFRNVVKQSRLQPADVTVVEAHGTGTAVGDPAEYDSIRSVLGGSYRENQLTLSSVKGLVGHIECTSGIVSLIKVLLMLQKRMFPPQASFTTINPAIKATPADKMHIPTAVQTWDANFRAALINNYGASGSNASIVVTQPPAIAAKSINETPGLKYPFRFCGFDDQSLRRYFKVFRQFLGRKSYSEKDLSLQNISFNLNRQSNRQLDRTLFFSVKTKEDLEQKLIAFENGDQSVTSLARSESRPVVLCFGGQVSTFIGLDHTVYERVAVFRKHLNTVDAVALSIGVKSIFPGIFKTTPINDTVHLQVMLFACQYACARSWIDSGVQPVAVVGHSFGELTSLCVSQSLSLQDTVRMIVARATLIRDSWGSDKGAMLAVEADLAKVEKLLAESSAARQGLTPATIACFNGPRSFTLAGAVAAIDAVVETISKPAFSSMKYKRLNVTNAFHCALLDPLLDRLEESARGLNFREPVIPVERATESRTEEPFTAKFVADHIRSPVFFNHAIQRLAQKYSSCIFLEAGSNSTVTNMANRALGNPSSSHFQAINVTNQNGWNNLVDSTLSLWKVGLSVHFWAHQSSQTKEHSLLLLPPYQFEPSRHWTELKSVPTLTAAPALGVVEKEDVKLPDTLLTFVGYQDSGKRQAKFRVNTMIPKYEKLIQGHIIAQTAPICPATVQLDLAIESIRIIRPDLSASGLEPQIQAVENSAPICVNSLRAVWLEVTADDFDQGTSWQFQVYSDDLENGFSKTIHTTGQIIFRSVDDVSLKYEFARFERHFRHQDCVDLMRGGDVDEVLQNRNIYKMFAEIVDYGEDYRGLQKLVSKENLSAGYVVKRYNPETWLDGHLADSFCQVGGIYVNCMTERASTDMFIANGIEQWIRSPKVRQQDARPESYHVLAIHHRSSDKAFLTDVFAFDSTTGALIEVILGISYVRIPKASMSKLLSRLTVKSNLKEPAEMPLLPEPASVNLFDTPKNVSIHPQSDSLPRQSVPHLKPLKMKKEKGAQSDKAQLTQKLKAILAELSGLEVAEIKDDSELADLGIDSLMGMEMAHEIEKAFTITLPESDLMEVVDMPSLIKCVQKAVGGGAVPVEDTTEQSAYESADSDDKSTDYTMPSTPEEELCGVDKSMHEFLGKQNVELNLPFATVMEAFNETKSLTDDRIKEYQQTYYVKSVLPMQSEMCVSLVLEAFDQLNVRIRSARAGDKFTHITHPKEHTRLVDYLYKMLEDANLINIDGDVITRTAIQAPRPSKEILDELVSRYPDQNAADKLTFYTGSHLAEVLRGETDGIKLIFGTQDGRELVSNLYGDWPINRLFYRQMEDFLERLISKLDMSQGPIKILEMGAGTGGTTKWLVPLLAKLNAPVEYTFTDLAPSFVAAARKKYSKQYPFMKFRLHDIEKAPADDLIGTQHIIVASNAVHATHSLSESGKNIRKALRPDGFLMMLEMTGKLYWVDIIFGLFEGWWYFDDGRTHAVTHESQWEKSLQAVGYGHVDWTDGVRPENKLEKLIIAFASGTRYERLHIPRPIESTSADCAARQAVVDRYAKEMTSDFGIVTGESPYMNSQRRQESKGYSVLVTGATGSLGCHLVAVLTSIPDITSVVCVNRRSRQQPLERQHRSLLQKEIFLSEAAAAKLRVIETDMSKPELGLPKNEYDDLLNSVTHIVHNAWLMNAKWPLKKFEPQLQIMRNLLELAYGISLRRSSDRISFQFISSIATVGHRPIWTGNSSVPEEPMTIDSVLPTGYGEAKYICERMIDETLHKYPERFRAMVVRPGQVAGSSTSGYWNTMEHLSFLVKSSQTLCALPEFDGVLSWTPVDAVASTLVDLLLLPKDQSPFPFYHIDNPVRQLWKEMIPILADALDIPRTNIIPFQEWIQRVKDYPRQAEGPEGDNPAILLVDFLDKNFIRMSCGGLLLETKKSRAHSQTLANLGPVSAEIVELFIKSWKRMGFLRS
ncbi:polyketide synthase, putative [Talaromyces stipitatus ATCC 10500]|uniref:Polyketide synthase, putative n=1 Tax=Talaromyces stipitatus (strain ATCC 10500 / CBS 375.48 / QM 6759 / NRRL 1006) TaxID=441959 RepID=B8MS66_TALSN|nr:polyketide synthase, putative [Talaromyces stipitatus ATCC 10500]EED12124.1 polyketide synthase, putative [Talaromyces stipitatus ATCC 10500]